MDDSADLMATIAMLNQRVQELEAKIEQLSGSSRFGNLQKIEYKIGKLFVRELSGTLNIGIASYGTATDVTDLTALTAEDLLEDEDGEVDSDLGRESWFTEERWFDDFPD